MNTVTRLAVFAVAILAAFGASFAAGAAIAPEDPPQRETHVEHSP